MKVIKRNKIIEDFDINKIVKAITAAFKSQSLIVPEELLDKVYGLFTKEGHYKVEDIQDIVENLLIKEAPSNVAKSYILYREQHKQSRLIAEKINYIKQYAESTGNAASNSNTDANANNSIKNVASIEPEVFKDTIRILQRQMMKDKLNSIFPEVAKQYIKDIEDKIIYINDEASSPIQKAYCGAYSTYPIITEGCGNLDSVTPSAPNDIQSFSGQITNIVFALSAQTKGAVALGDYIISLNYMVVKEFGEDWYIKLDNSICNENVVNYQDRTIKREIRKGMKQFIYGVNQPQGNRGFQSPFTNLNFFDKYYFEAMFGTYFYPDGTQPKWEAIDVLQRLFIELLREIRLITPVTFPVTTFALLYDENGYKDKEYEELCAEEWAKGSSHFLYHSSNADSLSSCCRVQNKIDKNYFNSTTGMIGLMTGSCNVITLNINRIVQNWHKQYKKDTSLMEDFLAYLETILERVYKYHIAYKTMLYELEELGMITYSKADYLYIKKLYSTIGILGYYEAAQFLGYEDNSEKYIEFQSTLLKFINDLNKLNSIHDSKRPFIFNLEAVPGENMAVKFYKQDKEDGYWVPEDQILYSSYFFNPWKEDNVLTKLKLHGGKISEASDGGW